MSCFRLAVLMTALLSGSHALAINKCIDGEGKVVFQDAPCAGRGEKIVVRPASGDAALNAPGVAAPADAVQKLNQQVSQMAADRRRRDLEVALPNAYRDRANHNAACDQELNALREKKSMAKNNLAGATWENSISGEMNAVAKRCETRNAVFTSNIEAMLKECQTLGGCK
ncbi:MAG: DUF4124 domain-containing protein [Roseateles sp.]|nr:MAG: DUF4124 domain-containing protein [Roseateles sp.]